MKPAVFVLVSACLARAEVHPMTLRQAVETALKQNPDIALARLDEEKARQAIRIMKDPFYPRITVGSGLAYSNGFPMSIEGAAPSVVQARATEFLFNRQQSYQVAQAKEDARGAALSTGGKRDEVAYRTASLYLDAERASRVGVLARKDAESLEKVLDSIRAQVSEGRALPLAQKQAELNLARARQLADSLGADLDASESALAVAIGLAPDDRVQPVEEERRSPALPASEEEALDAAIASNKDLKRLESQMVSKGIEMRGARAARLPRVDLVAQYGMLARFNNYDEFFWKFQRNNGQIGMSFQLPLLAGPGVSAQAAQSQADLAHLKIEFTNARNRVATDLQQSYRDVHKAEKAAEVAGLDLEVAREQLSVNLAQMQEGRLTLGQVEQARIAENDKWIAFYDAQYAVEKARWNVLRLTGALLSAVTGQ
ncbi:MAG TPA: TolC family protein [Bryobacteraceae bacterium]